MLIAAFQIVADISIHAPARGATADNNTKVNANGYFNPRPPRGGRRFGVL